LASEGFEVRAASRRVVAIPSGGTIERVAIPDLSGRVDWTPLIRDVDAVVHLAGVAHRDSVDEQIYDNVIHFATSRLAAACAAAHIRRLIFVSSIGAQTGSAADQVLTERDAPRPASAYDRAKLKAEEAVRMSGCPYTILRPVLVYGPGVKGNMAKLMKLANSRWPLPFGGFQNRRSLLALGNLVDAISFCLSSDLARNETFVVADPEAISVSQMLALMRQSIGRPSGLYPVSPGILELILKTASPRLWDRIGRDLIVNPAKLLAAGWRPPFEVRTVLKMMMSESAAND
jgi:UDP-glucose 4-epimerase